MIRNWRAKLRSVLGLAAAVGVGWRLSASGWPWWAWLPAALLSAIAVYVAMMLLWFLYRKLTYERFAAIAKRRLRERAGA